MCRLTTERCSESILTKYTPLWMTKATELLEDTHSTAKEVTLACKILSFLLEYCKEIPELHKPVSIQNIRRLILVVNSLLRNKKYSTMYYLVAVMLYHYPEVCEQSQELMKKIILQQIDSTQKNLINASAKCYVLLSKATERSFQPPPTKSMYTRLTYNQALLCNSLHAIMDELFSELTELKSWDIWDQLDLPTISEENVIKYYNDQKQRFLNLCIYLSSMLCGCDAKNSVVPFDILEILCRGLAVTPLNLKDKTSVKRQMLYIILPKLHIGLLTVLNTFINGFAQELIPFGKIILNLLQQTLRWTSTVLENHITFSNSKSFKNIRLSTYKCLLSWLINTGSLSGVETIANEYMAFIMKDITPERDCMLLTVQKPQHWSKRVMKRFKDSQYENNSILNNGKAIIKNGSLDADLCKEALVVLQNILHSGSVQLKQAFYKNMQNTVISLLYNFYLANSGRSFYKEHNKCRLELFKVLRALQMNPHTLLRSPIQYYLKISHRASYDVDLSVAQEARLALAELEKIIHPTAPTLQLLRQNEYNNEFLSEDQVEEPATATIATTSIATAINTDKKSRIERKFLQEADISPPACKRQKITMPECTTMWDKNSTESFGRNDKEANSNESQTNKNFQENVRNVSQETEQVHYNKEQGLSNSDELTNVKEAETRVECESITRIITDQKQDEQPKDSSSADKTNKMSKDSPSIIEEVQDEVAEEKEKESDIDDPEMLNLFVDIPVLSRDTITPQRHVQSDD
ncbi:PREDICTED: proline-, glutamic acid- and leucine-rich protein 1-like isoform X3 [Dinoponera quadriceps]|uniref:Proline-, glutamic acid- and leucine-rich protein 1-like isoform X3 n=1 Tax=Dinoponera quadriceps TaxID=609295 RepID=A0A6P3YE94_DINQU|nr:PREDICTED: proline-, glutamic acid- and leucine-rich protein 1-like isoform X3 [Dinoponera quadriceps]